MTRSLSSASAPSPSAAAAPLIEAAGLGVRRDGRWLVRNVSLSVRPGEIVTLIGPNGSGKSTTVKAMLGVLSADEGRIERRAGLKVGYVPQKLAVDWTLPLTVERMMRLVANHPRAAIEESLAATGVAHLVGAEMRNLSGGEFQRVLLARAIAGRPDLLVLDEPVQGVDFNGEVALYELIGRIRRETGCGILLVSHDLHIVMAETDTVICLNGHVCCQGPPRIVAESDEYARLFGPRARGALAVYAHHHDHAHLPDGRVVSVDTDGTVHDHLHDAACGCDGEGPSHHDHHHHHHHGGAHSHPPHGTGGEAA
ncbi:ATP-binding cassette domain-containing protein [Antarcticirhabdus aurantiaca]|uniref:Metal ABC transporter ATP-binding protein n=1 Tax=Antarcticirhabdus aurantiaca TaxID=2606717 RepID=A0ACD4NIH1_9HYPH|nr:metal ABC transporter ATP-binding protein [Antarcticirhabdus aurantiaca]WAJ26588.1 metal ABC transporter ATP-binding protein [Jeongeuplla avenae]